MRRRLFRSVALLAGSALALSVGAGPALGEGQDAGENGQPRGGMMSSDSGFAVCMDGAAQEPRCYMAFKEGEKVVVLGQGSDYNGNSIVEQVVIDPKQGSGETQGTGRYESTADGITIHVFFVYLGKLDLTVTPNGMGTQGANGLGCASNRFMYTLSSSEGAIHPAGLKGNLHVFGQDYPLSASKTSGDCGAVWLGAASGGFFVAPPSTAALPV